MKLGLPEALLVGLGLLLWKSRSSAEPSKAGPAKPPPKEPGDVTWPKQQPPLPTPPTAREAPPAPPPVPKGWTATVRGPGLRLEPGTAFWYPDGSAWFVPDDPALEPYHSIPGSTELPHP
jgi:hypothetical protein